MIHQENKSDMQNDTNNTVPDPDIISNQELKAANQYLLVQNDSLQQLLDQTNHQISKERRKVNDMDQAIVHAGRYNSELQQTIALMQNSRSWKAASPLRGIAATLRKMRNPMSAEKILRLMPVSSLEQISAGSFRVVGEDPQLLAPENFSKGLYLIKWHGSASKRILLKLYPDYGQGHLEIDSQTLGYLSNEYEPHEKFVQIKSKAKNLRIDPGEGGPKNIYLGSFRYIRLNMISAVRVGLSLISQKTGKKKIRLIVHYAKLCLTGRKHEAMSHFAGVFKNYGEGRLTGNNEDAYQQYIYECEPDEVQLSEQIAKSKLFKLQPVISVIVPVYNTNKQMLIEMIESVRSQTYGNWELCLADGFSQKKYVIGILKEYADKDKRIKVVFLQENFGIAGNTNAALDLASGDYIALLDHDDLLPKWALYSVVQAINDHNEPDILYSDEDKITFDAKKRFFPHFKPDWSPDLLRSYNYITHLFVAKRELVARAGNFVPGYDGSQDHDLILRTTELTDKIIHIPQILYHWRSHSESTAESQGNKSYTLEAGVKAISSHLQRMKYEGIVEYNQQFGFYNVNYKLSATPLVSIIIPNYEHANDLRRCIESIYRMSSYHNFEIIVVENNSRTKEIFAYYDQLEKNYGVRVIKWDDIFNYAAINNYAVKYAKGEMLLFLNNDTEVISSDWIEQMLQYNQRKDVGAVGARLYYADDSIQHAGVILGFQGIAGHSFSRLPKDAPGYMARSMVVQNVSAVTAACMMMSRKDFDIIGGFDEKLAVAFNDIDICMKLRQDGKLIVFNPHAELYHHESISRGAEDTTDKQKRFLAEIKYFKNKWKNQLTAGDPYYNPHLDLEQTPYKISGK